MTAIVKMGDVEMEAGRLPNRLLRRWLDSDTEGDLERMELIEGVLVYMPPAKSRHAEAHSALLIWIGGALGPELKALIDAAIFLGDFSMLGPDIAVLPKGVVSEEADPSEVLLAIEISDSSLAKDLRRKAPIYGRYGVREYWAVDVGDRLLHIHRAPGEAGYAEIEAVAWDARVAPLFAPDLTLILADILPEAGP